MKKRIFTWYTPDPRMVGTHWPSIKKWAQIEFVKQMSLAAKAQRIRFDKISLFQPSEAKTVRTTSAVGRPKKRVDGRKPKVGSDQKYGGGAHGVLTPYSGVVETRIVVGDRYERYVVGSIDRFVEGNQVVHFHLVEPFWKRRKIPDVLHGNRDILSCLGRRTALTDEYLAENPDGRQRDARGHRPQGPSVPEFGQYPVDVVFFFRSHLLGDDSSWRTQRVSHVRMSGTNGLSDRKTKKNQKNPKPVGRRGLLDGGTR